MNTTGPADSAGISAEDFEGGARRAGRLAAFVCIFWSLFQLWVASDFPFYLSEVTGLKLVFNNQEARQIHLAFRVGLALSLYPAVRSVHPLLDRIVGWGLAAIGVAACLYLFVFKLDIANRAGLPNRYDLFFSIAGMLCVMAAVYRALGLPLLVVAMVFIIYVMFGHLDVFPDAMRWKGASLNKATWHFWMQTEGVFGVALGVSASMIFLFLLFGALLESAGAGNYFIKLSFAALGHLRGGPAKAAVVASGLSGIYSGSSIANVVTTGTFTIPLMKKTGLPRQTPTQGLLRRVTGFLVGFAALACIAALFHLLVSLVGDHAPSFSLPLVAALLLAIYLPLVWLVARRPDLGEGLSAEEMKMLPRLADVAVTGYHFVLPILVLLWYVLVTRLSPGLSAYWACLAMMFVLVTQHPLKALFRGQPVSGEHWRDGWRDLLRGLENGARNMISIAIATAIAGIIIGTVSLTGAHQFIGSFVETVSAGNLVIMLLLVAVMSLVLGMGLPTTANYIVVSSLMAPVIVMVGAQNGLIVPLVAVHLFVFYFGILADDTPPVGLAAFAAAAISRGDPIRTGIQGFSYDIRTAVLPFMFIFNTDILLIDVGFIDGLVAVVVTTIGMLAFCSATQRFMLIRNRVWETLILLLVAFTMFRPDFWLDRWVPPFDMRPGAEIVEILEADGGAATPRDLRVRFVGPDFDDAGRMVTRNTIIQVPPTDDALAGLADAGVVMTLEDGRAVVGEPFPGTPLFQELQGFDFYADDPVTLDMVLVEITDRPAREWAYLPAALLLGLVLLLQRRRRHVIAARQPDRMRQH